MKRVLFGLSVLALIAGSLAGCAQAQPQTAEPIVIGVRCDRLPQMAVLYARAAAFSWSGLDFRVTGRSSQKRCIYPTVR